MAHGRFATVITCMDGRVQEPVLYWMKKRFQVDYVDTITEPGPDHILTAGWPSAIDGVKKKVDISVRVHGSNAIAMVSHHDCAGNPVSKEKHLEQNARCIQLITSWGFNTRVLGLWVNEEWQVEVVFDSDPD